MFKTSLLTHLLLATAVTAAVGPAQAQDNSGKASLDSVVPDGPVEPRSGAPEEWPYGFLDKKPYATGLIDRLEYGDGDGPSTYLWDAQGWYGGDYNKFWWKTEGEGLNRGGSPDSPEFQALYNRMLSPFFGAQAGIRYATNPGADRAFAVLGIQGLAPYWFESDTAFFVSEDGDVSFRGEFEYELLLTQRLVLQPRLEFSASADDVPEYGLGQGINNTEMGLRLRYEIKREFAPYIGVRWEQLYGETKDIARRAGENTSNTSFVVGIRAWY